MSRGNYEVGWCHNCSTFQLRSAAPRLVTPFTGPDPVPCCVVCRAEEPWAFGVWDAEGEFRDGDPAQLDGRKCPGWAWVMTCARKHAERQESLYPGDCDCERALVHRLAVVRACCRECDVKAEYMQLRCELDGGRGGEWEIDGGRCEHWREMDDAVARAARNPSGRSRSGPVLTEVGHWR